MSIPNPFRPVCGQLGGAKDYVQDGLLLLIDSSREPKGQLDALMNFATGETIALPYMVENNDGLGNASQFMLPWSDYSTQYTAEVCCKIKLSNAYIDIHPWVNRQYLGDTTVRLKGSSYLSGNPPAMLSPKIWPAARYDRFFYSPLPPLGTVLSVCCQWGTDPIVNLTEPIQTDNFDGIGAPIGSVYAAAGDGAALYSFRLYSRTLSTAEREHNYKIDQQKFMK